MIIYYSTLTTTDGKTIYFGCDTDKPFTNDVIIYK
jgi:hypothetical protein